jgi:hypothetical protein
MNKPIGLGNIYKKKAFGFTELKFKKITFHDHFPWPRLSKKILGKNKDIRLERIYSISNPDITYYFIIVIIVPTKNLVPTSNNKFTAITMWPMGEVTVHCRKSNVPISKLRETHTEFYKFI